MKKIIVLTTVCSLLTIVAHAMENAPLRIGVSEDQIPLNQKLPQYALSGDIAGVRRMLARKVAIEASGMTGYNALQGAAYIGNPEIARLLLSRGAAVDGRNQSGATALHVAALVGKTAMVELLLAHGADVDGTNLNGSTPLICAAANGHEHTVRALLERNANWAIENANGYTALRAAVGKGSLDCVRTLLEYGALATPEAIAEAQKGKHYNIAALLMHKARMSPTPQILQFFPGLRAAARADLRDVVHYLCTMQCYPVDEADEHGFSALQYAANAGYFITMNRLIDAGAEVDRVTPAGYAALHISIDAGKQVSARTLIARGADVDIQAQSEKLTALHLAILQKRDSFVELLLASGAQVDAEAEDENTAVHHATYVGAKSILTVLAKAGANLNAHRNRQSAQVTAVLPPANGQALGMQEVLDHINQTRFEPGVNDTALHMAVRQRDGGLIEHLLKLGANPLECERDGNTPLHTAVGLGFLAEAKVLIEKGNMDLEITNDAGCTPLVCAVDKSDKAMVAYLISKGAKVNMKTTEGWTPLHLACQKSDLDVVRLLLDHGAEKEVPDAAGNVPLMYAAACGNKPIVDLLIKRGVNMLATDLAGFTAAHHAAAMGIWDVVECFLLAGFSWDTRAKGRTLLHCAAARGQKECCLQLQPWIVRQQLSRESTLENSQTVRSFFKALKNNCVFEIRKDNGFPAEVLECIFSSTLRMRTDVLHAAAFGLTYPRFYQNLLKRATSICSPSRALMMLCEYAQSCLSKAHALRDANDKTAQELAEQRFPEVACVVSQDCNLNANTVRAWLLWEQKKYGCNENSAAFFKDDDQPKKGTQKSKVVKRCLACNKEGASQRCGQCQKAFFCNRDCLKLAWGTHKKDCVKAQPK